MRRRGFTLVELLMVVAIIGIITLIATFLFTRLSDRSRVRQGATELAAALRQARSDAQRYNQNVVFTLTNSTTYTVVRGTTTLTYKAPTATQIAIVATGVPTTVTYLAPYGEVSFTGAAPAYRVSVSSSGALPAVVGVVGVTGKVVSYDE